MFNKIQQGKQLMEMRKQAKKLQDELAQITETVENGDVTVKVTADQKVVYIKKDGVDMPEIVEALNDATKKVQKKAAQKMMETQGLSGLLSGLK